MGKVDIMEVIRYTWYCRSCGWHNDSDTYSDNVECEDCGETFEVISISNCM